MRTKNQIAQTHKVLTIVVLILAVFFSAFGVGNLPSANAQGQIKANNAEDALKEALQAYIQMVDPEKDYQIVSIFITENFAYAVGKPIFLSNGLDSEEEFVPLLARLRTDGTWEGVAPKIVSDHTFNGFLLSFPNEMIDEYTKNLSE